MMETVGFLIIVAAAVVYLAKQWALAKQKRDTLFALRPFGGLILNEKKPSAIPFLFK